MKKRFTSLLGKLGLAAATFMSTGCEVNILDKTRANDRQYCNLQNYSTLLRLFL